MKTLADRIQFLLRDKRKKAAELARFVGVEPATVSRWKNGQIGSIEGANLVKAAAFFGAQPDWLASGKGPIYAGEPAKQETDGNIATRPRPIGVWDDGDPLNEDDVEVKRLTLAVSAGDGRLQWEIDEKGAPHRYSQSWCRNYGLNPEKLVTVVAVGNSMPDSVPNGASVVIDTDVNRIQNGDIYAIDYLGEFYIKILLKDPDGSVRIVSENTDKSRYPDIVVTPEHADALRVLGLAVEVKRMLIRRSGYGR